jgi:PTH1 family peptidyl-tRNA hydrolase
MKLIVGLGNPGKDYIGTRHNIGFCLVDNYVQDVDWTNKFDGLLYSKTINEEKIFFFKPQTYMNNSGIAISKIVKYYDISLDNILVIHDDLDLEFGTYRIKFDSSSGGHNGIKSIISYLNGQEFWRLKIGISNDKSNVKDYVLGKFKKEEKEVIDSMLDIYNNIIDSFINNGGEKTMSLYNKKR